MPRKRAGFADLQGTLEQLRRGELRCPTCNRKVTDESEVRFVQTLGQSTSSLATLSCPRCRTAVSIRLVQAE